MKDLQICAQSKLIIINIGNMHGRDFKDQTGTNQTAADLARALFEAHAGE